VPLLGPPILPVTRKDRYEGLHRVGRSWLYVNRGLGWLVKVRFGCRPEITVLSLCGETQANGEGGRGNREKRQRRDPSTHSARSG
jgi:hypothetical protein